MNLINLDDFLTLRMLYFFLLGYFLGKITRFLI